MSAHVHGRICYHGFKRAVGADYDSAANEIKPASAIVPARHTAYSVFTHTSISITFPHRFNVAVSGTERTDVVYVNLRVNVRRSGLTLKATSTRPLKKSNASGPPAAHTIYEYPNSSSASGIA